MAACLQTWAPFVAPCTVCIAISTFCSVLPAAGASSSHESEANATQPSAHVVGERGIVCARGGPCGFELAGPDIAAQAATAALALQPSCHGGTQEGGTLAEVSVVNNSQIRVHWASIDVHAGTYEACWDPAANATEPGEGVHVATVEVVGPPPGSSWRCVGGRRCAVTGVEGVGLEPQDRLAVRETACGTYDDDNGSGRRFQGNTNAAIIVTTTFHRPVRARYLRLYPTQWHVHIALRAALIVLVCPTCASSTVVDLPDEMRRASSENASSNPAECFSCGRISSSSAWVAERAQPGEWYELDAGVVTEIAGVALRGRGDADQWVEQFFVSHSTDRAAWTRLREVRPVGGFPNGGVAVARMTDDVAEFVWPGPVDARGGTYRLCWLRAAAASGAGLAEFVTPVGELILDGPAGGQEFRCNVGRPCHTTGLVGEGLQQGDVLRPMSHCLAVDPSAPAAAAGDANGTDFDWGGRTADLVAGRYMLCWCRPWTEVGNSSGGSDAWSNDSNMALGDCGAKGVLVNAGILVIAGPRQGVFTCYAGQECVVQPLLGEDLRDGDRLRIIEAGSTCGAGELAPIGGVPDGGRSREADVRGTRYRWRLPVSASGGNYTLCWCSARLADCGQPSSFAVPAGTLRVLGPHRDQTLTCFGGQPCALPGITGVGLQHGDEIEARRTCGSTIVDNSTGPENETDAGRDDGAVGADDGAGFPGPAVLDIHTGRFEWASAITVAGSIFRLCWRPVGHPGDHGADVGPFVVLGPRAGHVRLAASTLPLTVAVFEGPSAVDDLQGGNGVGARAASDTADRVLVSYSCSSGHGAASVPGIPGSGISQKLAPGAAEYSWGSAFTYARGGEYRLCWCAGRRLDGYPRACRSAEDFVIDAGVLALDGPTGGQAWTCAASRTCTIAGLRGFGLSADDRLLIKDGDCRTSAPVFGMHTASTAPTVSLDATEASFDWGAQAVGAKGGQYRVCWCTSRSWAAGSEPCTAQFPYRFAADAGVLVVTGPKPAHGTWALQFGGAEDDLVTSVAMDSAEPEKGLGHAVLAGWTYGTIENNISARLRADTAGLTWNEGRSESDYTRVRCGWAQTDSGNDQFNAMCMYPRLGLQALDLRNYGDKDGWLVKIGYNGSLLWTRQIGTGSEDVINSVAVGVEDHSIFVGGYTGGNMVPGVPINRDTERPYSMNGGTDCFLLKLDQHGEYLAAFQFGSNSDDWVNAVAVGLDGSLFVALTRTDAMLDRAAEGGLDSMILKFTAELDFVWAGLVASEADDVMVGLILVGEAVGQQRPVFAGRTRGSMYTPHQGVRDIFVARYSGGSVDNREVGRQYGSGSDDVVTALVAGSDGSIYVAGYTQGNLYLDWEPADEPDEKPGGWDGFVMKLDTELVWVWTQMLGTEYDEYVHSMVFLPGSTPEVDGDLLVAGSTFTFWPEADAEAAAGAPPNQLGHEDAFLLSIAPDGRMLPWRKHLRSPGDERLLFLAGEAMGGHAYAVGSARGGGGFVPEVGTSPLTPFGGEDIIVIKYTWGRAAAFCFRGSVCEVGIPDGVGLGPGDRAIITSSRCGLGTAAALGVPAEPSDGAVVRETSGPSGLRQRFLWGDVEANRVLSASVGRYVLCWCAGGCEGAVPLEISVIFIAGPDANQTRTCVAGEPCDITGLVGRDLNAWDRVAVMDSCTKSFVPGFPHGGITEGIVLFESRNPEDHSCMTVDAEEIAGVTSNWGCSRVTADAGTYRLCFCTPRSGRGCTGAGDFGYDIGTLMMTGPFLSQYRKCVQYQPCEVRDIEGVGLQDGDMILALDRCRIPPVLPAAGSMTVRGIPGLTTSTGGVASDHGSSFVLTERVDAAGGLYRMCWCRPSASFRGCTVTDDFALDFGRLMVVAPTLNHLRRCFRGQPCSIVDLEGFGLADGDQVYVLRYCPERTAVDEPENVLVEDWPRQGLAFPAGGGGRAVSFGPAPVWSDAGLYQLCWCMGGGVNPCREPRDFYVRIGELDLAEGPPPDPEPSDCPQRPHGGLLALPDEGNCTAPSGRPAPRQHHRCRSAEECTVVLEWPENVTAVQGRLLVASSTRCNGLAAPGFHGGPVDGNDTFTWPPLSAPGGPRALCWCSLPGCDDIRTDFAEQIGFLEVEGPYAGHSFMCEAGRDCLAAPLTGVGLRDGQALLPSRGPCPPSPGAGHAVSTAVLCGSSLVGCTYRWGPELMDIGPGSYRLCWCHSAGCSLAEFVVDAGTLAVSV